MLRKQQVYLSALTALALAVLLSTQGGADTEQVATMLDTGKTVGFTLS